MTPDELIQFVSTLPSVDITPAKGDFFTFYNSKKDASLNMLPFATIITSDAHDSASNLNRPGIFRLNIGVEKQTYVSLFGDPPPFPKDNSPVQTGHDFTTLDQFMPHPIYAAMNWICILNPSHASDSSVKAYLIEAHALAQRNFEQKHGR